jgi:primosomal protein N' (replication factor Y) (superfamily II helicase)
VAPRETARRVPVLLPTGFPQLATYLLAPEMPAPEAGVRVAAPFGTRLLTGLIAPGEAPPVPDGTVERELLAVLDESPFLPAAFVDLLLRAAAYYFAPPGELLRAAVPGRLLDLGQASYVATSRAVGARLEAGPAAEVLSAILSARRATTLELAGRLGNRGLGKTLRWLLDEGLVRIPAEEMRAARPPLTKSWVARGSSDDPRLARRPKQRLALAHLAALSRPASAAELRVAGATPAVLTALAKEGLVGVVEEERAADASLHALPARPTVPIVPSAAQSEAVEAVGAALARGTEARFLLDGVTGSGKTEVYLAALERAIELGRQGILLVPEIALAPGLIRRVVARFGGRVALVHSGLSDGERSAAWERARRGEVDAVVGPRSAVFAPLPRLGLIVVDEAHDAAYKQAEAPRYDARTVARVRAHGEGAVLLLGSATPSMEQEQAARDGSLTRLVLPARAGARSRATVEVVDLRPEPARAGDHGRILFASRTIALLQGAFDRGEQAIVLLNRRGFSPSLLCRACGHDFRCAACSVARTYHRRGERLLCHYCGDFVPRPRACPACGSEVLMPVGFGTERLAERFEEVFPGIPYAVLDRDAAARRGGAARVLADFESGVARALLGTQMVAKGHDFPNATVLAVLDADALLSFPDFRSAERTFQLVTQAAGRVGRGEKPGIVAVQTARPEHEAIAAAVAQDHPRFAEGELRFRRTFGYPPFSHLLLALWTAKELAEAESAARAGRAAIASHPRLRLLGPAPAPLERLKGLYRVQLLARSDSREALAEAGDRLRALPVPPRLDRDPQSLL